jgi:hypothetical protein
VSKGRPVRNADNLIAICGPIVYKMWEPRRLTTLWVSMACYRDIFTFFMRYTKQQKERLASPARVAVFPIQLAYVGQMFY